MTDQEMLALLDPRLVAWLTDGDDALLAAFDADDAGRAEAIELGAGLLAVVEAGPGYGGERGWEQVLEQGLLALVVALATLGGDAALRARAELGRAVRNAPGGDERAGAMRRAWEAACATPAGPDEALSTLALAEAQARADVSWVVEIAGRQAASAGRGGWLWRALHGWLGGTAGATVLEAWLAGARAAGERAGLGWASLAAARVRQAEGRPAQALTRLDEAAALFGESGDDEGLARALGFRLRVCLEQQDAGGAEAAAAALARLAITTGCPRAREVLEGPFSD
jgi:hypothetical protein